MSVAGSRPGGWKYMPATTLFLAQAAEMVLSVSMYLSEV